MEPESSAPPPSQFDASTKNDGGKTGCVIVAGGCLVLLLITAGVGIYVAINFDKLAADMMRAGIDQVVKQSDLPEEQKEQVMATVKEVVEDFKAGRIDVDQLERIFDEAEPLIQTLAGVFAIQQYVKPSGLSDEEKAEAELTVRRFVNGTLQKKIPQEAFDQLQRYFISENGEPTSFETKKLTDDELREALSIAKEEADKANIPIDIPAPNIAEELKKAVDRGYGR